MEKEKLLEMLKQDNVSEEVQLAMLDSADGPQLLEKFLNKNRYLSEKAEKYLVTRKNAKELLKVYMQKCCIDLSEAMETELIKQHKPWTMELYTEAGTAMYDSNELLLLKENYSVQEIAEYMKVVKETGNEFSNEWLAQMLKHKNSKALLAEYVSTFGALSKKQENELLATEDDELKKVYSEALKAKKN